MTMWEMLCFSAVVGGLIWALLILGILKLWGG